MKIKKYGHGEGDFWRVMGPMFASEEVYKAQGGYPMFSDPSTVWYLAFENGDLIGWIATQPKAKRLDIRFQYMLKADDDDDDYQELVCYCCRDNPDKMIEAVEVEDLLAPYLNCGFEQYHRRGQFVVLRREAKK